MNRRHLAVIHYGFFAGPHNRAQRLCRPLSKRGWDSVVLIPNDDGSAAARFAENKIPTRIERYSRLRDTWDPLTHMRYIGSFRKDIQTIQRVMREEKPDVVLIAGLANPHAAIAAREEGLPVVWQLIDTRLPLLVQEPLMALVRRYAHAVMFNGQMLQKTHTRFGAISCPAFIYYPPVDLDTFVPSVEKRRATRGRLGIPMDAQVVGMVANWNAQKGIEYFVRSAAMIFEKNKDVWFLTVGATYADKHEYGELIQRELDRSGIPAERFIRTGRQNNVEDFYPAMDVKVITSVPLSEGTTTTAIESHACGVPVVATNVGAVAEIVANGQTGFVVPPMQPEAIAQAGLELVDNPGRRAEMGAAARLRATNLFGVERCADVHEEALDAAIRFRDRKNPA